VDDYRALFDANPRPLLVADRETVSILEVNRATCELYGWSRDEMLGMTLRDIRPAEEVGFFEASRADNRQGPRYARAARHHTKAGKPLDVSLEISIITFRGRPSLLIVITNITGINDVERRFRLLVEHSTDGISLVNAQNVVEYVSPGGSRALGYADASTLVGKSAALDVHPDDVGNWKPPAPGETTQFVARTKHRDGSWRWMESSTTNLTHDPVIRAYVSNYRDITQRVVAEKELRESQQRLEFLLSATSAVTYWARARGTEITTTFIGENTKQVLGYDASEFYARDVWFANVHPDDHATVKAVHDRLRVYREPITYQYRFRHADGNYRFIRDNVRIVGDEETDVDLVGYMIDVTDAVRAEEAVRRSERNFRTLIESAPIATFVHRKGRFVYLNRAAVALLGFADTTEIVGTSVFDYVHPEARDELRGRMQEQPEQSSTAFSGLRLVRADGAIVVVEGEAMLLDYDGQPSHVVMCHDVTERDTVFARIAMADRMLSIGTLAAGVAHEINNPLAYIATNLELLAAELPNLRLTNSSRLTDTTLHRLVSDAREGVGRVNTIVRDLRSLSRPEEHKHGAVDVTTVLTSSLKMANNEIRHRARVVQDYETDLPPVEGDPSKLGQVVINLLLNAAQAIGDGDVDQNEIRICASTATDGKHVKIDICDTGSGIPSAIIGRIFDPFFTTKEPGSGTGLGLAISHQIIRSMGGDITVESKAGAGSTFSLILPIANGETSEQVRERRSVPRFTRRVLIVDDEAAVGRSLQMLLAPETDVVAVLSAEDALAQLDGGDSFDAILCDLMMPHNSGMQLYERITVSRPEYLSRIIFMTGGAFTPQARAFLAKLDRPHLEKPFSEQELRDAIASAIG
jgi:PAS domain S-box-containing protein